MMLRHFAHGSPDFKADFDAFLREDRSSDHDVVTSVTRILDDVETKGGKAVADYTAKYDELQIDPTTLDSDNVNLHALAAECPLDLCEAIDFAHDRIAAYHMAQRPSDHSFTDSLGVELGWRWTPLDSVGVYVPGGRASYPSSVLMNTVPARIAGFGRIVMVAPAPGGELAPSVAYAALKAGVHEYYPIGGAQAIGALALGAARLKPVDKIVGPGNAYVAEAKRQVFGRVGIDTIAGPSEVLVIADHTANPEWVAADLLAQAEHDPSSQSILVTVDEAVGKAVEIAVENQLKDLATGERARTSWDRHGAIIHVPDLATAAEISNRVAPEHLELAIADPDALLPLIRHAGAVFLGHMTPEALGDYVTGSNHVLPTSRSARFGSGLGLNDFMKRMSIQRVSPKGFAALAPAALRLAEAERLPAHARSITIRSNPGGGDG
jgi:histidinol dehydrogenase